MRSLRADGLLQGALLHPTAERAAAPSRALLPITVWCAGPQSAEAGHGGWLLLKLARSCKGALPCKAGAASTAAAAQGCRLSAGAACMLPPPCPDTPARSGNQQEPANEL